MQKIEKALLLVANLSQDKKFLDYRIEEILNLRNRVYDEIRLENAKASPSKQKLQSLNEMLGVIDSSFMDVGNAKNISELTQAINYSDNVKTNFYESENFLFTNTFFSCTIVRNLVFYTNQNENY